MSERIPTITPKQLVRILELLDLKRNDNEEATPSSAIKTVVTQRFPFIQKI